jgi:hypothetical protein
MDSYLRHHLQLLDSLHKAFLFINLKATGTLLCFKIVTVLFEMKIHTVDSVRRLVIEPAIFLQILFCGIANRHHICITEIYSGARHEEHLLPVHLVSGLLVHGSYQETYQQKI